MLQALMTQMKEQTTTILDQQAVKMDEQAAQMKNLAAGNAQMREVVAAQDLPVLE